MMEHLDDLYLKAYWHLRYVSVLDLKQVGADTLLQDLYMLTSNLESMYMLDANNFFSDKFSKSKYVTANLLPLKYVLKVCDKLNYDTYRTKHINEFLRLYRLQRPELKSVNIKLKKLNLPIIEKYDYRISRYWLTYPDSLRKLHKKFVIEDAKHRHNGSLLC